MQFYSNPADEADPHKLPDIEIVYHIHTGSLDELAQQCINDEGGECDGTGYYYCFCSPGCLPDGQYFGPYTTWELALVEARAGIEIDNEVQQAERKAGWSTTP